MTTTTYYAHCNGSGVELHCIGRIELADNGKLGDQRQTVELTPGTDGTLYLVLTSNGDDSVIGWLDGMDVTLADDVVDAWLESFGRGDGPITDWLEELLGDIREGRAVQAN